MVNLQNSIIVAIRAMKRNKMRTALTSIGIIIGVSSVIIMVGIGSSARIAVREKIYSFGTNAMSIRSIKHPFVESDLDEIKESIPEIQYITPMMSLMEYTVKYKSNNIHNWIYGVTNDYFLMNNWPLQSGSYFTKNEIVSHDKVVIIGSKIKEELFIQEDPIGKVVLINKIPFKVMGVLEEKGSALSGRDLDSMVVGPYTTLSLKLYGLNKFYILYASTYTETQIDAAKKKFAEYFRRKNSLQPGDYGDLNISSSKEQLEMADEITKILTRLLAGIASISLFVGGVGIMNIMLVSVSERTREIGIRMAIGAKNRDILMQFLIESLMISSIGGMTGIILGIVFYFLIATIARQPFIFSLTSVFVSFLFATSVGIIFGYYPAKKASRLNPIDALRHE